MSATQQRDRVAWVVRFFRCDPAVVARQAAKAAAECGDVYKQCAVRAWLVAALAEQGDRGRAEKVLREAMGLAATVQPVSSRGEALFLLFQAACAIGKEPAAEVYRVLESCPPEHWRVQKALRDAGRIRDGQLVPMSFIW